MVEFGKRLRKSIRGSTWEGEYLDYSRLKAILKGKKGKRGDEDKDRNYLYIKYPFSSGQLDTYNNRHQDTDSSDPTAVSSSIDKDDKTYSIHLDFHRALDQEIEKVVLFLLQEQGRIAQELSQLASHRGACAKQVAVILKEFTETQNKLTDNQMLTATASYGNRNNGNDNHTSVPSIDLESSGSWTSVALENLNTKIDTCLETLALNHEEYRSAGQSLVHFVSYVEMNVTAVRKILKKHDKRYPQYKLGQSYLSNFTRRVDSHLDQLYHYGGLSAMAVTLKRAFSELHILEVLLIWMQNGGGGGQGEEQKQLENEMKIISKSNIVNVARHLPKNIETQITTLHEPTLENIHLARSRLELSTNYVQVIAAQSAMFFEDDDDSAATVAEDYLKQETEMSRTLQISSFLNLCSTFLYMTNYYIVAPTCGTYAAKLGSTEAMAGIIIGMTPNAALIATVLYSWWSNYSYKSALIFAAGSSMLGNICYALALQQNSLFLVLAGRFFNGFGSARSINRRFIADAFSRSQRTAASAAFVTAGALGMAAGPAIAAIVAWFRVEGETNIEFEGSLLWTTETAPGWVMLGLWSIFFVTAIIFFEEPDRPHLKKLKSITMPEEDVKYPPKSMTIEFSEVKPLLYKKSNSIMSTDSTKKSTYRKTPVFITLWIYFVLKLVLEALLSSCGNLTDFYFGWDSQTIGTFLAFLGLLMFPANVVVARLSHQYEDRELMFGTLMIMFFSILGIFAYNPNNYTVYQYVFFSVCMFISTNILEGPNMSLLSKTIPKSWAKGIFNSGFLATEAGTLARSIGDVIISAADSFVGKSYLLNATFFPTLILIFISLLLVRRYFDQLVEVDDDDDNDSNSRKSDDRHSTCSED